MESNLQCDVAYIYLNVSLEKCFENMKYHSSGEPLLEESMLHNSFHLFHLHSDMNPSKKLILNLEEGNKDNQSAITEFYWRNIVKEVCKMKCGKDQYPRKTYESFLLLLSSVMYHFVKISTKKKIYVHIFLVLSSFFLFFAHDIIFQNEKNTNHAYHKNEIPCNYSLSD